MLVFKNPKIIWPNLLTSLNLLSGCIAVLSFLNQQYILGIVLVLIGAFCDFLDGLVARALKVTGDFGKELDSLADVVSFGFVPGIIMYTAFLRALEINDFNQLLEQKQFLPFFGFVITIFSAIRLAIFNTLSSNVKGFIGLPTPANTLFFLSFPIFWVTLPNTHSILEITQSIGFLIAVTLLFSYLMVSKIPMLSLKLKGKKISNYIPQIILIVLFLSYLALSIVYVLPLTMLSYIALSVVFTKQN
jgi:CDP-diacylglycerol--serine O-phosphatidyltransferase